MSPSGPIRERLAAMDEVNIEQIFKVRSDRSTRGHSREVSASQVTKDERNTSDKVVGT